MSCITAYCRDYADKVAAKSMSLAERICAKSESLAPVVKARCGIICTVSEIGAYLRVVPDEIWLLPDSAEVIVYSNVDWVIV